MTMLEMKKARNRLKEDEIKVFMEQKDKADDYRCDYSHTLISWKMASRARSAVCKARLTCKFAKRVVGWLSACCFDVAQEGEDGREAGVPGRALQDA